MLIQFGLINYKLFIPFSFPIFVQLRRFVRATGKISALFKMFSNFVSYVLAGILYYLLEFISKSPEEPKTEKISITNEKQNFPLIITNEYNKEFIEVNREESISPIEIQQKKIERQKKISKFLFLLKLSLLNLCANLLQYFFRDKMIIYFRQSVDEFFQAFFLTAFSIIILKTKLYSHQFLSLIIITFCFFVLFIETICFDDEMTFFKVFINVGFFAALQFFYCLLDVMGKQFLDIFFESPYFLMFSVGVIDLILLLIIELLTIFVFPENWKIKGVIETFIDIFQNQKGYLKLYPLDLLFGFIWGVGLWLTIYYFTPTHFIILETLVEFIETTIKIFNVENYYNTFQKVSFYISYPLVIFSAMIYTEIIILNFMNLNYNTKFQINLREKVEDAPVNGDKISSSSEEYYDSDPNRSPNESYEK